MIRTLATALWVCAVVGGTCVATLSLGLLPKGMTTSPSAANVPEKVETVRIGQLSIPTLKDGAVSGYVVMRFNAVIATARAKRLHVKVEDLITDEAYKATYATAIDLASARNPDLERLTAVVTQRVNERLGEPVVQAVQIQEFTYVDRKDVRK